MLKLRTEYFELDTADWLIASSGFASTWKLIVREADISQTSAERSVRDLSSQSIAREIQVR